MTDRLAQLLSIALRAAVEDGVLETGDLPQPTFERPRKKEHGDWATNVALVAAKGSGNPRDIAQAIADRLPGSDLVERVEIAGPGFLNFHLSVRWLHDVVRRAADPLGRFGRSDAGAGVKVNVEYVSANPTGHVTVVLGRHAAVGDAMANLLEATGHLVTREYYFNDAGRQVVMFARSVAARYLQHFGIDADIPEDGYHGDYVAEIARDIAAEIGDQLVESDDDSRVQRIRELAVVRIMASIKTSLGRFGTRFDVWFSEATLHSSGEVMAAIDKLKGEGLIEEKDGALWFRASRFGDDKDRVVIRANGQPTYFAADIGYLLDKFSRGFDRLIYLLGADHHGTVPRLMAAAEALGYERDRVEVPLVQMVTLSMGGKAVKASKRAGVVALLDDLLDEVGKDAARYTFLTRSIDASLEFDIELAKEQAPENPVYYVQYAHARICSILRRAAEAGHIATGSAMLDPLAHDSEMELMRKLASYEEVVPQAAELLAPQRITRYVEELASTFSSFYRDCKVVSEDRDLTAARLALCLATQAVIADGLGLLGVDAPERM